MKKKYNSNLVLLNNKIDKFSNLFQDFDDKIIFNKIDVNSCFDFNIAKFKNHVDLNPNITNNKNIPEYKSLILDMIVTNKQHNILQSWFNSYITMYNAVITFFNKKKIVDDVKHFKFELFYFNEYKNDFKNIEKSRNLLISNKKKLIKNLEKKYKQIKNDSNKQIINNLHQKISDINKEIKIINEEYYKLLKNKNKSARVIKKLQHALKSKLNWNDVRTKYLKNIRDDIQKKSALDKKNRIRIHVLDSAIKTACSNYKSCITNYLNNNIKKFRIKYWRLNRNNKILEIEKESIMNGKIFNDVFGNFKFKYNNKKYNINLNDTVKIIYYSDINKYYLLVSQKITKKECKTTKTIGIDQGIKPFISCRSNDELIQIGNNVSKRVENYLKRIENIKKANNLNKVKKRMKEKKYNAKIKNIINETHWKTINYIIKNYGNVIIGNLSMKNCTKKGTSKLNREQKKIGLMMRMSEFRKRLEYKCLINGIKMETINEAYTSKVCCECGNYKKELKGEKIYHCLICKKNKDRDLNSATNMILLKL